MSDLAEKRAHDRRGSRQLVFAATGMGVAVVETAGDSIGRFRLAEECEARDVSGGDGWVAVATPSDVLVCEVGDDGEDEWMASGFGPSVAVGFDGGDLLAAGPDGELGRVVDVAADPTDWLAVAEVDGAVSAIDGPLVGASDGVYRFTPDGIFDVGLDDVRDVSAAGVPLAATGDGLFRLGNGWLRELDGPVDVVAATDRPAWDDDPSSGGVADPGDGETGDGETGDGDPAGSDAGTGEDGLARGHAAAGDQLYEYHGGHAREGGDVGPGDEEPADDPEASGDEIVTPAVAARAWRERSTPVAPVVALAHGQRTYAVTADGTFLLDRGEAWATQAMGLPDVVALATPA